MPRWIHRDFPRPTRDLVAQFKGIPTSILSDSMNRFQAMDAGIKALKTGTRLVGVAFTLQTMESANWETHQALTLAQAGDVLVVAARGSLNAAVWGHVMTAASKQIGLAGVVIDGCIRDAEENRADSLPIFCRGVAPAGPHKGWQGNINVPVACAGVVVKAGDIIVGDDDGIVVVPQEHAQEVLAEALERIKTEENWYQRIAAGEKTADILGLPKL